MKFQLKRRLFQLGLASVALATAFPSMAQQKEVEVALIAPMTGPWARSGDLMYKGAKMAVEDINAAGGIKALGGAKMKLVVVDAGDKVETARNAAERMLSQNPNLTGATGSWLSSFTLAITEVTERAELPMLTLSFSGQITSRGFKYIFQTSPTADAMSAGGAPALVNLGRATGKQVTKVAIVSDNTAAPMGFTKPMREGDLLTKLKLTNVYDEIYTPPLSDASGMVQKLRSNRPDILFLVLTPLSDYKIFIDKMNEMGLGKGRLPAVGNNGTLGSPELLNMIGKDKLEGLMNISANWAGKGQEKLIADFQKRTGEPWMAQDPISTYGDMWVFAEAMEMAKSADRVKVAEAIRKMDLKGGAAQFYPGGRLKFDETGRNVHAQLVISQWQNGVPVVVYPTDMAVSKPVWPSN